MNRFVLCTLGWLLAGVFAPLAGAESDAASELIERGRYLVVVGGCNDCHTPAYMESEGNVPEADWLTGSTVGFQGPWGTSYAANLRLRAGSLTEAEWLARARAPMAPPMPWFNLRQMHDEDLRAVYAYLRKLGPSGSEAPVFVPPGVAVATPYIEFVPRTSVAGAGR